MASFPAYSAAGGASIKASAPDEASELLPTISDEEKELFSKALAIIKVEKPVDTDIPNNPETLIQYVAEGCTQLKNSKFRALYRRVASIESAARTWSRVVDSAIKCVPEPGTLVWGIIRIVFSAAVNHVKTLEKVEAALAMIFDKLIFAQRWLQEYREAFQVRYFAVRLYVAILRFWHHTWGWITKYHNGLVKLTLFLKNYETDYRDLENLIHDQARLLRDAAWSEAFSKIIQGVTNTDKKFDFSALLPRLTPRDGDLDHYRKHHKAQSSKYQKDTCRWIHDQEEFKLWRSTSSNVLWIYALPAWGKTVLAWYIIEYLLSARQPVLYFYCVHDNPAQSKAPDILRSLVLQILRIFYPRDAPIPTSDTLSDDIFTLIKNIDPQDYENHDSHSEPKFRELFEAVGRGQSVYIVLDGLDEAIDKEIESLLDFLGRFADEDDACIKLLAISRKEKFLQNRNQENRWIPSGQPILSMQLPADRLREDLVFYSKIKLGPRVAELMKDRSEQERADKLEKFCDTLVNKDSDAPPFLLVHLVVKDMLSSRYSIHEMEECVSQQLLPHGLQKSYARILVRMEKTLQRQDKERARHLLAWASHHYPKQTISLAQLLEIMRIRTGHSDLTEEEVIDLVSETCGSLLEFRSENQTLHFTHISVLEYLRTEKEKYLQMAREFPVYESGEYRDVPTTGLFFIRSDEANILLFDDCMDYLLRKDQGCDRMFSRSLHPIRGNPIRPSDISKRYPLFPYAAQFWPYHLQRIAKHDRKYDQELRENHEKALKCLKKVEAFLNDRTFLTWMEGVIAIKRGIEWMKEQLMAVQSWLSQLKIQCDPLDIWINDISSNLFDIWEGTLLYNPNEIFFLDDTMIFRSFRRWRGSNISFHDANRDIYDILSYEEKSGIDPLFHTEARDKSLSNKFSPGEGGNASFGFISYDGNNSANKGILRIDRRCNYPRLVWEMRTPVWFDPLAHDPNGPECTKRSSIMYNCKTSYPHSLLQCLSACMSADGSQLAAIFAEIIPRSETVKMIRLATVLWEFHAPEEAKETFETWKSDFERAKQSYQTALYEAKAALDELKQLLSRTRVDLAARKIQDKLSNASSQAAISHTTMTRLSHRRPPVPSSALSHKWASPRELYPEMDEITYTDAFMTSRYLVAYKGSHHLVTPRGVYNLDGRYYEYNFGFSNFEEEFVVVPGGEYTLTFSDPVHKSLEIRQTHKDAITRRFKPTSFGDFSSFDQIVDCSSTGRLVALSLKNPRNAMTTLVVIDLVDGMFKIVLQESQVQGLRVSRAFFCPRDIHMIVTCKQDVIGQETKLFLVDIPNSKTKHLETMQLEPQAVLCSDCSDSSYYSGIGGRLLPMESASTGGAGLGDMVTDLPSDKNHNLQIRQGAYLPHALESLMRILHDTEQSEKLSCGSVGYVLQNRTILGTDNTLMDLKDVGKAEEASSGSFLPFHFRTGLCQPSSNGALVGAAYMYVQADRRQMSELGIRSTRVITNISWIEWEPDLRNKRFAPGNPVVTKLDAVEATKAELACRGIALSPHFHFISVWVGRNIWFFSTRLQDLKLLKLNDGGNHSKLCCLDVRFSACQSVAVALWGTDPSQTADSKHSEGKELSIYMLSDKEVLKTASISVECQPRSYCFLPDPAVRLLAVTTLQGLQLFTYDDTGIPKLVLELSESQINDKMKISKTPNGPSSPQSTAHTEVALGDHGQAPLYFSTCGKFLYSANWDIFANVQDLLDPTSIPDGSKVLESFKSELEEKRVWKEVPQNHPEVLFEDVLYASGQNRFKIFRVRTYLVLGWSADGNNLYYPQPQNDELAYTWYRRILCAIPRSREMWKATLIWPGPYRSLDHLSVVLFPAPDSVEYQLPRIIFTPLTAINLLAEEGNKDANGDDTDGWFRGHAFGCPYHFKS